VQAGRGSGAHDELRPHRRRGGRLRRPMRRVLRRLPRPHDPRCAGRLEGRLRRMVGGAEGGDGAAEWPRDRKLDGHTVIDWLTTTDHKRIGLLYLGAALGFFVVGGLLAEMIRAELAVPGLQFVSEAGYSALFTIHGTTMIFLFASPIALGFANYLVPLQIRA